MPSTLAVSGGASTAVLGLYVIRAALERIERGAFEAVHTSLLLRDSSEFDCPALCDLPVAGQNNVYNLLFLVLGIFVLELIVGSTLTYCACVRRDYSRELRRTVIHRSDYASGTEAHEHKRTRRTFWRLSWAKSCCDL